MDVFSPYRPGNPYGQPGYGMFPTRPGNYMNGLGDVVMQPYRPGNPYGSWGYGIYGLGVPGDTPPVTPDVATGGGGDTASSYIFGMPVVTGLVGVGVGVFLGYFVFGR